VPPTPPLRRAARQPPGDWFAQVESPGLDEEHGRSGGELLADRAELEPGRRRARDAGLGIGQALGQFRLDRSASGHHGRAAETD
jgi:hypothetical protein